MEIDKRTAAIIARQGGNLERAVSSVGYEVVGLSNTAVLGLKLVALTQPDVVVVENELQGEQGIDCLEGLREVSPDSALVLVVAGEWVGIDRGQIKVFAVVARDDPGMLARELGALDEWLDQNPAGDSRTEEGRTGRDRRVQQDWAKVGWERRSGTDRRLEKSEQSPSRPDDQMVT